jgi:DNA polymerase-1
MIVINILTLDTEHSKDLFYTYEDGFYLTCVGVLVDKEPTMFWFDHSEKERETDVIAKLQSLIDWADVIVMHNAKHDIGVLRGFGFNFKDTPLHCTMVSEYLIRGQDKKMNFSLDATAERHGVEKKLDAVKQLWDSGVDTYDIPADLLKEYCLKDCEITRYIYDKQVKIIKEIGQKRLNKLQNEFIYCLSDMECNGFYLDKDICEDIIKEHLELSKGCADRLKEIVGEPRINLGSPCQLSAILYGGVLKLSWKEWTIKEYKTVPHSTYREKEIKEEVDYAGLGFKPLPRTLGQNGYYKTDKSTITQLGAPTNKHREVKSLLLEYSRTAKVAETLRGKSGKGLLSKIMRDGYIHPKFNQTVSATGRLTSSDPNGQNLPRGNTSPIKTAIRPTLDGIMQVDLSQIEWRDAAWLSQDTTMIEEINRGIDQHVATVTDLMELKFVDKNDPESKQNRFNAKIFNFRMIFGGSPWGFFNDPNMPKFTLSKWKKILKDFFAKYHGLRRFHIKCIQDGMRYSELRLPTGRWFKLHKTVLKDGVMTYKENHMRSWPVQGLAGGDTLPLMAVIIRRGMRKLQLKSKMILTVHDSIVFDYAEDEKEVLIKLCYDVGNNLQTYFSNYYGVDFNVKLEVEVEAGPSYGELNYEKRR